MPPNTTRNAVAAVAVAALIAAIVSIVILATRDGDGGAPSTATGATTSATGPLPPEVPPLPEWGDVPGGPTEFAVPDGGDAAVRDVPDGTEVELTRDDGSRYATAEIDGGGVYREVRYFDDRGRLELVVNRIDLQPAGEAATSGGGPLNGCRNAQARAGFRWTALPIGWRLNARSVPRRLGASRVLTAARAARSVWGRNANRCRIPDRSRAAFAYRGTTTRGIGRNRVNTIGFGEVDALGGACVRAIACAFTWTQGNRAIESDVRIDKNHPRGYAAGGRVGRRLDLRSVLVHESGHTLGLEHVNDASNVMYPFIRAGTTTYRRLGRGDALANNALY